MAPITLKSLATTALLASSAALSSAHLGDDHHHGPRQLHGHRRNLEGGRAWFEVAKRAAAASASASTHAAAASTHAAATSAAATKATGTATHSAAAAGSTNAAGSFKGPTPITCPAGPVAEFTPLISNFPKAGQIASLVKGDTVASTLYNKIIKEPTYKDALAIPPRGTDMGDLTGVVYDIGKDSACAWTYTGCHKPKQPYLWQDTFTCDEPDTWGLTFDDGPFCDNDDFYDFLSDNKLKATLFYIGTNIVNTPARAQRGFRDGHEICVHTWAHRYMTSLTNEQAFSELYYTQKAIKDLMGVTPTCFRPPFGDIDDRIRTIAQALGMRTIHWNHDTFDWMIYEGATPAQIEQNYDYIYGNASNTGGVITLTHEINYDTIAMFEYQYPTLKTKFSNVVPVGTCVNITHPYAEKEWTYPTFTEWQSGTIAPPGVPQQLTVSDDELDQDLFPSPDGTIPSQAGGQGSAASSSSGSGSSASATSSSSGKGSAHPAATQANSSTGGGGEKGSAAAGVVIGKAGAVLAAVAIGVVMLA